MSSTKYKTVIDTNQHLNIVKKSKFYSFLFPAKSIEDFELKLEEIKEELPGARHYCYAYRIMGQVLQERYQDDKEPTGTAGVPILDVLQGNDLIQCGIVVVRYFGGTKLGTGGLSRAYSQGAIDVVEASDIVINEEAELLSVTLDYSLAGKLEYYIENNQIPIMNKDYASSVTFILAIEKDKSDLLRSEISEMTGGKGEIVLLRKTKGFFSSGRFVED